MMEVFRDKTLSDREKYIKMMSIYSQRRLVDGKLECHIEYFVRFGACMAGLFVGVGVLVGASIADWCL